MVPRSIQNLNARREVSALAMPTTQSRYRPGCLQRSTRTDGTALGLDRIDSRDLSRCIHCYRLTCCRCAAAQAPHRIPGPAPAFQEVSQWAPSESLRTEARTPQLCCRHQRQVRQGPPRSRRASSVATTSEAKRRSEARLILGELGRSPAGTGPKMSGMRSQKPASASHLPQGPHDEVLAFDPIAGAQRERWHHQ